MARIDDIDLPADLPFDYQMALDRLAAFRAPRNKIRHLCATGRIVRVKKGLYVPGWRRQSQPPVDPLVVSGLIYGPSYVSLETALAIHGLIPERVEEITCVTNKRAKLFDTPIGRFSYHPVNDCAFSYGVDLRTASGGTYFLALPEKAICDRIALVQNLQAARDVSEVLRNDLRMDPEAMDQLSSETVDEIARRYRRKNVSTFARWLRKHQHRPAIA